MVPSLAWLTTAMPPDELAQVNSLAVYTFTVEINITCSEEGVVSTWLLAACLGTESEAGWSRKIGRAHV